MTNNDIFNFYDETEFVPGVVFKTNEYYDNEKYKTKQVTIEIKNSFGLIITSYKENDVWLEPKISILTCSATSNEILILSDIFKICSDICKHMISSDKKTMDDFLENIQKNLLK